MPSKSLENIHGLRWQWEIDGWGKAGLGEKITYFLGKARIGRGRGIHCDLLRHRKNLRELNFRISCNPVSDPPIKVEG